MVGGGLAAFAAVRHFRGAASGHQLEGGIVMGDASAYDRQTGFLLRSFYRSVATDVASVASPDARVLEVGCGPGRLSIGLASDHGLDVTGLDLDPAMVERARLNAEQGPNGVSRRPSFVVGDVAALPFPDESFDLVVSTLSMHHWADPAAGLTEIARVLRSSGRAVIWDVRAGVVPFHGHAPDPADAHGSPLRIVSATAWAWPWKLKLTKRIEFARDASAERLDGADASS